MTELPGNKCFDMFSRFNTVRECGRQTDGHTGDKDMTHNVSTVSRGVVIMLSILCVMRRSVG